MTTTIENSPVEEICPGLTRQWIRDRRIVVFKLTNSSRELTDAWFAAVVETYKQCPPGQSYLCLQDLSQGNLTITPYGRQRTSELSSLYPELRGRTAVLVSKSLMGQMMKGLLRLIGNRETGRNRRIFFHKDEALRWLEDGL